MHCRGLCVGVFVTALALFGTTVHAQEFGESDTEESETTEESDSTESTGGMEESEGTTSSTGSTSTTGSTGGMNQSSGSSSSSASSSSGSGDVNALESGAISLSFSVPGGGNPYANGAAGVWLMATESINLGINLGLGIEGQEVVTQFNTDNEDSTQTTGFDLFLAPAVRYYLVQDSSVAPYILGQVYFQKFWDGDEDTTADPAEAQDTQTNTDPDDDVQYNSELQPRVGLVGGFGLEWFPIEQFSVGGHVGLGFDLVRPNQYQGGTLTRNGARIGTLTSALTANIYF